MWKTTLNQVFPRVNKKSRWRKNNRMSAECSVPVGTGSELPHPFLLLSGQNEKHKFIESEVLSRQEVRIQLPFPYS
jgi:hypothetical protein